jgi:WD40 repeat protein
LVACEGHGKDIAVFDARKGTLVKELRGHFHPATAGAFLPDGRLVSGGEERTIRLWDVSGGKGLAVWVAMPADPTQNWSDEWVGYSASGRFVGSTPLDRLVGWQLDGDTIVGPEDARRRRVERLFLDSAVSAAQEQSAAK